MQIIFVNTYKYMDKSKNGSIFGYSNENKNKSFLSEISLLQNSQEELTKEEMFELKSKVQSEVMKKVANEYLGKYRDEKAKEEIRKQVRITVETLYPSLEYGEKQNIIEDLTNEISGYGILEKYLNDPEITEIIVERFDSITIEKEGTLYEVDDRFDSEEHLNLVIERIISPLGRQLNWSSPTVNGRLPDGSRIAATHNRVAVDGSQISVRKFKADVGLEDLIEYGALNEKLAQALIACIKARLTIVFSGGTGSGKSTWMNALSPYIDPSLSIITIEDPCELQFEHPHVRRWEAQPPNIEGKGEVTIGHLVKHALRNRPDIVIVGEVRGAECYDFARANATGHKGSMTTLHSDTPEEAADTLVALTSSAGVLNQEISASYLAKGIDIIVQLQRMSDRSRKMVAIHEVVGSKDGTIVTKPLVEYEIEGFEGKKVIGDWKVVDDNFIRAKKIKDAGVDWDGWL